jgi:hypothetical protein
MKKTLLITTGLLAASVAIAVHARAPQSDAPRGAEAFAAADANRDGRLSLAEFEQARSQRIAEQFRRMDLDGNGSLTQEEMRQAHRQHRELRKARRHEGQAMRSRLRGLDANDDKALTRAEIGDKAPKLAEHFDDIDLDRDGRLTREELRAGRQALRQAR